MKILIAAPVPKLREGGVSNVVHNMAEGLRARGHEVSCLFREDVVPGISGVQRFETVNFALRLASELAKRGQTFDVVNIHAPAGFAYGLLRRWRAAKLPPYVMLLHGIEERRNHAMLREAKKGRAWYFGFRNRLWQHIYHMPLYRWSIVTADQAVVINRETWSILQLKYNREAGRVWYIANGVESRFFCQRQHRDGPALRLLFAGTWLDHKGVYYLRDAFEALTKLLPELRLTIACCGAETNTVKSLFAPAARERVEVIRFVPSTEMPALYARHDIFVLPSLMEGMPIVLLEAMAMAMPVVTTETCGMMDIVEDGYNGLLAKPADAAGIVAAVRRMAESRELRARLGCVAQETMKRHTWARVAEELEKVFSLAAAESTARADTLRL
ncbi:MAG TPA: glycosyltransferase family 4 protein [Candidatus Acidoferrum sp.]|nr:glycosyltransferase family 4 protein [Candidatus Acidoferrum sp.]